MAKTLDNIHWEPRKIDGYNKPHNFVMGPREPGKTTNMWVRKIYKQWKKNKKPWAYFVRSAVEICEAMIETIFAVNLNKFFDDNCEAQYTKGAFKDGIVDIKINGELFIRIISLNIPLRRIKLATIPNIGGGFFDEYIINPKSGEKYIKDEAFKLKEAYTTYARESDGMLKFYYTGNVYSLFNPLFLEWKVDTNKLKKGEFYVGDNFVIEWIKISAELRAFILEHNPTYAFDEEYAEYALEGTAINDVDIKVATLPPNYSLRFVFRISGKILGVYQNNFIEDLEDRYFVTLLSQNISPTRTIFCFEFSELVSRCALISREEANSLNHFKMAMRKRLVAFGDISAYYFSEEIYKNL